ncbi:hypothetical protein [Pseudomonas gingeri]|uniref:Uncharacterized protein n=2 Tax=Pseudomonas gingeri TaxID=117681 RepID=A0A7Y8CEK2_9PSED|nr:hypothetical protein [Pseudomonas gingeri]NWA00270.1 hypothetical protein [Pseudomonas gingeri]NWA12056.1 hypothetical protein [Pseudomonas gingeri]NWA58655.1 hypothetical protein [Pseudomonas gingeri]NWA98178.1 hypothetical protein [Pseudomonas gingeri]NWB00450.1 hypothetical protein [Pseudomonas gingeri]
MSEASRNDLIRQLRALIPDSQADYFQIALDHDDRRLWLEYGQQGLLLMLTPPFDDSPATDFVIPGPGGSMALLFDTWFQDRAARALFLRLPFPDRTAILDTCDLFLQRCHAAPAQE